MLDVVRAKPKFILHIIGETELLFQSFVCWSWNAMFLSVPTLALHGVHVLAYMTQHLLVELGAILQCATVKKGNQSLTPTCCGHIMICKT